MSIVNKEDDDYVLECINRWDSTGLLYGLPLYEKQELAPIFDNAARIALSKSSNNEIDLELLSLVEITVFPVCRRLYRRVGSEFNLEKLVSELIKKIIEKKDFLNSVSSDNKVSPTVEFCIEFADQYEDEVIHTKNFTDEQYSERVQKILSTINEILLNEEMVSFVDRTGSDWKIMLSDTKKSKKQTRYWNQSVAKEFLQSILSDTNKGI